MKRTALTRRTWLRSSKPLSRRTRLQPVNRKRLAKRRAECFGRQAELCRTLPCLLRSSLADCHGPVQPHHEPPRSCGGRDSACVPLCARHHHERHVLGRAGFESTSGIDLRREAARLAERIARGEAA